MPRFGRARWWWSSGVLIAIPAIALAILGLRTMDLQRAERRRQIEEQQAQAAILSDTAFSTALARIEETLVREKQVSPDGSLRFALDSSSTLVFRDDRVYFSEPGIWPAESRVLLSAVLHAEAEQAMGAEAQSDYVGAMAAYQRVSKHKDLRVWANQAIARLNMKSHPKAWLNWVETLQSSDLDSRTPDGMPVMLLAIGYTRQLTANEVPGLLPFLHSTLEQLRAGRWWLSYQQRKMYDQELMSLLQAEAASPLLEIDPRLTEIAAVEGAIRLGPPFRHDSPAHFFGADGVLLVVRPEASGWLGAAYSANHLANFVEGVLGTIRKTVSFPLGLSSASGDVFWGDSGTKRALPLRSVPGWQLRTGEPASSSDVLQRWLWYGFVALLLLVLVLGLAMSARILSREMELARLQSEFVAGVTHEFKSPITGIRLLVERINGGRGLNPANVREYCAAMLHEGHRLEQLVNRLLETHRIQSGQKRYHFAPHCTADIVEAAIANLRPQAGAKGMTVTLDADDLSREIQLDRTAIQDSVENLLDNAIKYSPPDTSIVVAIRHHTSELTISVRDQGTGIDRADLPRIFDRFYRGHRSVAQSITGTGLGLALVKAAAEGHLGGVEVSNVPGRGAEFRICIPIRHQETNVSSLDRG